MPTTEEAFLDDIVTNPGDDGFRLILADWLDDHGQPERGEFIRVGCELARWERLATDRDSAPRAALRQRERELLHATRPGQWSHFPEALWGVATWEFRRGFPEAVSLTAEAFAGGPCRACSGGYVPTDRDDDTCEVCRGTGKTEGHAAALFAAAPILSVTLSDRRPACEGHRRWDVYSWADGRRLRYDSPDVLPGDLFRLLPAAGAGESPVWGTTAGEQAARDALAAAALLLGRRAAWPCPRCKPRDLSEAIDRARLGFTPDCADCGNTGHAVTTSVTAPA